MLKLYIDNVGIVKESEIELNGMTVITGHNNSGKTTVSKVLYSLVSSVEDLGRSNLQDKNNAAEAFLEKLTADILMRFSLGKIRTEYVNRFTTLYNRKKLEVEGAERYLEHFMENECNMLQNAALKVTKQDDRELYLDLQHSVEKKIKRFSEELKQEYEPVNYVNKKLDSLLNAEFNSQILPVNGGVDCGAIRLEENGKVIFDVQIGKEGVKKREKTFSMSLFDLKCIFMDDVYVLDDLVEKIENLENDDKNVDWLRRLYREPAKIKIEKHKQKLINSLWQKDGGLYGKALNKEAVFKIYDKLERVFGDKIVLEGGKLVCANSKIHVGNLAMGAKVFALLKMLLDNGAITRETILILDEPEVHLHPEWQNILAELLVLIMQEMGVSILLTTHSSQFLMALEAYIKKYKHNNRFKVYATEHIENSRLVRYQDQTRNIKDAYYKLAKPMFDIKVLKDSVEE